MLSDLGKHCYAPPRFKRRTERSDKVAPLHSLSCDQGVHFEPTAIMGTLSPFPCPCSPFSTRCSHAIAREEAFSHGKQARRARKPVLFVYKALFSSNSSRRAARDLPCDAKLPQAVQVISHDVHMLSDLGKHCYAPPRYKRRMKKVGQSRPISLPSHATESCILSRPRLGRTPGHAAVL